MRLISRRVEPLLGAADALDLDDPRAEGSELSVSGASASASLTAQMVPETGR